MRKIILTLSLVNLILLSSCTPKDGPVPKSVSDISFNQNGAIPDVKKTTPIVASINPASLAFGAGTFNLGLIVDLPVTINNNRDQVQSMDVVAFYKRGSTIEKAVLQSNITTFPTTVSYTPTDFYNAFTLLNNAADFTKDYTTADVIRISTDIYYKNGTKTVTLQDRLLNNNFITSYAVGTIQGVFTQLLPTPIPVTPFVAYTITCPLTDASTFVGNFKVLEDERGSFPVGSTVAISSVAGPTNTFKFTISFASSTAIANAATSSLLCTINATGAITSIVPSQQFNYGTIATPNNVTISNVAGSKVVNCSGEVSLKLNYGPILDKKLRLLRL